MTQDICSCCHTIELIMEQDFVMWTYLPDNLCRLLQTLLAPLVLLQLNNHLAFHII